MWTLARRFNKCIMNFSVMSFVLFCSVIYLLFRFVVESCRLVWPRDEAGRGGPCQGYPGASSRGQVKQRETQATLGANHTGRYERLWDRRSDLGSG